MYTYFVLVIVSSLISGSCDSVMNVFKCVITSFDSLGILYLCDGREGEGGRVKWRRDKWRRGEGGENAKTGLC